MNTAEKVSVVSILAILVLLVGSLVGDVISASKVESEAVVIGKSYQGPETHIGVGSSINGTAVVTTSVSSEDYRIILKHADGTVESAGVDGEEWASIEKGDTVGTTFRQGRIWRWLSSVKLKARATDGSKVSPHPVEASE